MGNCTGQRTLEPPSPDPTSVANMVQAQADDVPRPADQEPPQTFDEQPLAYDEQPLAYDEQHPPYDPPIRPSSPTTTMRSGATQEHFEAIVNSYDPGILVIVQFVAPWCGVCKFVCPKLRDWAQEHEGRAVFIVVDIDDNDHIAETHDITVMPAFHFYKNGKKIDQCIGSNYIAMIEKMNALL